VKPMSKRVLLVSTPWEATWIASHPPTANEGYPVGLAYLYSYLESRGHTVEMEWLNNYPEICESVLKSHFSKFNPEVIGFQVLTPNRASTYFWVEFVHKNYPDTLIVLGGIHATAMYHQLLKRYPYVIIIRGEGELTFADLLDRLEGQLDFSQIPGIAYTIHGEVMLNQDRELIQDLDILPFPKHSLFFNKPSPTGENRTSAAILTARGCPNNCSFCCLNPTSKRKVRVRSVANVVQEVAYLVKTFPKLETIRLHDDTFFINIARAIDFCDEIIKQNIKISFLCCGRFKPITEELILKLEQAGFTSVGLGLESSDEGILKSCHKGITHDEIFRAVKLFVKSKIDLTVFILVGLPGETHETILNTAKFVQGLQRIKYLYYQEIGILTVYPGTEVYELMKKSGKIEDDFWLFPCATPYYTVENSVYTLKYYEKLMLSYISVHKIITPMGFIHQFYMLPWAFPYVWKYKLLPKMKRYFLKVSGKVK